jgi:hypothetical protein
MYIQHVDVAKLIKGRPLDNTEFMQWFKAFWDKATGEATGAEASCNIAPESSQRSRC